MSLEIPDSGRIILTSQTDVTYRLMSSGKPVHLWWDLQIIIKIDWIIFPNLETSWWYSPWRYANTNLLKYKLYYKEYTKVHTLTHTSLCIIIRYQTCILRLYIWITLRKFKWEGPFPSKMKFHKKSSECVEFFETYTNSMVIYWNYFNPFFLL